MVYSNYELWLSWLRISIHKTGDIYNCYYTFCSLDYKKCNGSMSHTCHSQPLISKKISITSQKPNNMPRLQDKASSQTLLKRPKLSTNVKLEEAIKSLTTAGFRSPNDFIFKYYVSVHGIQSYVHRWINLTGLQIYWMLGLAMFLKAQKILSTWL